MKKLFFTGLSLCVFLSASFAQDTPTKEDYKKYIDSWLEMDFRNEAIKAIELTSEEIVTFDPIFRNYMAAKERLLKKKINLVEEYHEEMMEDDKVKNQNEDRADFVEDYWEVEIDEAKLSKRYFDILEDKIPVKKAAKFFIYEDVVQNRIKQNVIANLVPSVGDLNAMVNTTMDNIADTKTEAINETYGSMNDISAKDYKRYIESRLVMDFRNESIKLLELTPKEIDAFDPVFKTYMAKRERLLERKVNLLEELRDELLEDDNVKNEEEDVADFIEDYWELEIDEMKLRKNSFDVLEDKINENKAIKFFLWEEAVQNRIKNYVFESMVPATMGVKEMPVNEMPTKKPMKVTKNPETTVITTAPTTKKPMAAAKLSASTMQSIQTFSTWVTSNRGKVDKSHRYSSEGLKALMSTLEAVKSDLNMSVMSFDQRKQTVMAAADHITVDYRQTDHADRTKEAFLAIAMIMEDMTPNSKGSLKTIANKMQDHKLMTKQANVIYEFFDEANRMLKQISDTQMARING